MTKRQKEEDLPAEPQDAATLPAEPPVADGTPPADTPPTAEPSKRDQLNQLLADELPGYDAADDEGAAAMLMDYINGTRTEREQLAAILQEDPRFAQLLSDVVRKKRGAIPALVRYFGKDFLAAEEGTPEYEEIEAAERERKAELERMTANQKTYADNLAQSMPAVEAWCKQKGYAVDEFLQRTWDNIVQPIMQGTYSEQLCELLDKGMNYDRDTADALAAGTIRGRNENINRMREERGDGLPKGITSAPAPTQQPSRRRGSILDAALNA